MSYMYSPPPVPPLTPPVPGITTPPPNPLVLNGLGLTAMEFAQTQTHRRPTRWLFWSLAVLGILFGLSNVSLAYFYVGYIEGLWMTLFMFAALGAMFAGLSRHGAAGRKAEAAAYRLHLAATDGGVVTVIHPDRVEQTAARWQTVMYFTGQTRYVETHDLMILEDDRQQIVLRAADLTPEEAQAAFEYICLAIPPVRQYATGRFTARRQQPAPPPFSTTAPACYERFSYQPVGKAPFAVPAGLLWWLTAAAMVIGGSFVTLFAITDFFLVDFLIVFALLLAGGLGGSLATLWLWRNATPPGDPTVTLAFTAVGLRVEQGGIQQFVAASDVKARRTENGARLTTPAGVFTFPWTATQNRQQLEWMLFGQRPASF